MNEPVFFVIPKWQIENWLAYLRGENVEESDRNCRRYSEESEAFPDVKQLAEMCRQQSLALTPPPSLEAACREYGRLKTMFFFGVESSRQRQPDLRGRPKA